MRYFTIRLGFNDTEFERMVRIIQEQTKLPKDRIPFVILNQIEREMDPQWPGCTIETSFEVEEKDITPATFLNVKKSRRKKLKPSKIATHQSTSNQ